MVSAVRTSAPTTTRRSDEVARRASDAGAARPAATPVARRLSAGTDAEVRSPTASTARTAYAQHSAADALRRAQLDARIGAVPSRAGAAGTTAAASTGATAAASGTTYPPEVQEVVDLVKSGTVDDATRTALADKFKAMDADTSHAAMEAIRNEGLQDTFLDQVLRDKDGNAVDPRIKTAVTDMMNTGRLDVYAETLATTSFNLHDPAVSGRSGDPHFSPTDNGVFFTDAQLNDPNLSRTMAHETFHAFSAAHGGPTYSAVDEGMGISVIHYAYENGEYSTAEAVYGTANYYRDSGRDPNYPMGSFANADPKLASLLDDIQARDKSGFDWRNDEQIKADYTKYWEQYDRFEDKDGDGQRDWEQPGGSAEQAEAAMIEGHKPLNRFLDWLRSLFG